MSFKELLTEDKKQLEEATVSPDYRKRISYDIKDVKDEYMPFIASVVERIKTGKIKMKQNSFGAWRPEEPIR